MGRNIGEKRHLGGGIARRVHHLNGAAPGGTLAVVDLAEVEHLALHDPAIGRAAVFDDTPVAVILAVFAAVLVAQEHGTSVRKNPATLKGVGRHYKPFRTRWYRYFKQLDSDNSLYWRKSRSNSRSRARSGLPLASRVKSRLNRLVCLIIRIEDGLQLIQGYGFCLTFARGAHANMFLIFR